MEKKVKEKEAKDIIFKQKTEIGCIGELCYNKETKKLRVNVDRKKCSREALDNLREALMINGDETEVEWVIPAKLKRVKEEKE